MAVRSPPWDELEAELEALLEEVCSRVLYLDTWQYGPS